MSTHLESTKGAAGAPVARPALLLAAALAAWGAGCTLSEETEGVQRRVDAGGGRVELVGSGSVQLGAGALDGDVIVRMLATDAPQAPPAAAVSDVLELTPHGTRFRVPARVTLRYASNAPVERLRVVRLADDADTSWEPVGGVTFSAGSASFETTSFSYYAVVDGLACEPLPLPTLPACQGACAPDAFCSAAAQCVPVARTQLCDNPALTVVGGELPNLTVVTPSQTTDAASADSIVAALQSHCSARGQPLSSVTRMSQAEAGLLDPCTDAPLPGAGNTLLVVGGGFVQRTSRYLDQGAPAPAHLSLRFDEASRRYTFTSRAGQVLLDFPEAQLSPTHDYFVVSLVPEPARGALVLHVYGVGEEGSPAAAWYFVNRLLPEVAAGTRTWQRYLLVEWTDDGDGLQDEGDTFRVLAQDLP